MRAKLAERAGQSRWPARLRGQDHAALRAVFEFDESAYGFTSFGSFLGEMGEVMRVVPAPAEGATCACTSFSSGRVDSTDAEAARLVRQVKLAKMGYEGDASRRRRVLSRLFDVMTRAHGAFTLSDVHGSMQQPDDDAPSSSRTS